MSLLHQKSFCSKETGHTQEKKCTIQASLSLICLGASHSLCCATVCTTMCWLRTLLCLSSREVAKPQVQDQHFLNITQIIVSGFIPKGNGYNILNTARLDREHGQYSNLKNSCSIAVEVTLPNLVMQSALFPISSVGCSQKEKRVL